MNGSKQVVRDNPVEKPVKSARRNLRSAILESAVSSLIEQGTAATTTLDVQRRAGVSRGALLHHFPTHASLLAATVDELVRRNERAVQESLAALPDAGNSVERAIRILARVTSQPAYMAELELWAVARTDPDLRVLLSEAERAARKESDRVINALFRSVKGEAARTEVIAMTMEFLRGLALSGVLRKNPARRQKLLAGWIRATQTLLEE